ncbi:MAG: hypothetical protein ABW065_05725 [Solirubrobacterales bacterium]
MSRSRRVTPPKALASALSLTLILALLGVLALTSFAAPAGAGTTKEAPAKVVVSQVKVNGDEVTISGRVSLPVDTAALRQRTRVALTLTGAGKSERLNAKIDSKRRFKATKTTQLTGQLTVLALVKIGGQQSGPQVRKRFAGPVVASTGTSGGGSAGNRGTTGGSAGTGGGGATGTPLVGLFKLDPGQQAVSGKITGTYFRMLGGSGSPVLNQNSPFFDKTNTPLRPGTDGGLSTVVYQPAPTPAFAGTNQGLPTGDALANRVVQPQKFFDVDFSIVTDSIGRGTALGGGLTEAPTPLPVILNDNGNLSGQVSDWTAAWNGLYFTQGSPKPDGSLGGTWNGSGTTPLTGSYDAATRHFRLSWQSLIQGGAFDGFTGQWFLEGTFVPA